MRGYRTPTKRSPYYVDPPLYVHAIIWCKCYPIWKKELQTLSDSSKGIDYSKEKVQSNSDYDATADIAMKRLELEHKINLLETTARIVMPDAPEYMIRGVTEDVTPEELIRAGMPYCKNLFYLRRQKLFYLLSKRI